MARPGRSKPSRDHQLAQALDLARRRHGLSTSDLAATLFLSPRTVRRYLNGERRPLRETVADWEEACGGADGRLLAVYDHADGEPSSAPSSGAPPDRPTADAARDRGGRPSARRAAIAAAALTVAALIAIGAVLLSDSNGPAPGGAVAFDPPRAASTALHHFTRSYVGDVWIRITPSPAHAGEVHRLGLRWGPLRQDVSLGKVAASRVVFFGKNNPDDVTIRVNVQPAARITFAEGAAPVGARDIKAGWRRGG
jgi:hypothetical protein